MYEEELAQKLKRQFELNAELDMDKGDDDIAVDEEMEWILGTTKVERKNR